MSFFFFNDTATTEIYTLSLHDALPISCPDVPLPVAHTQQAVVVSNEDPKKLGRVQVKMNWQSGSMQTSWIRDRKSTRLNSSHANISYAVFCLKKKKIIYSTT